jgi:hypothetical protein
MQSQVNHGFNTKCHEIDPGIKPVCDVLNAITGVQTFWSCEGHPERPMRPYVCFTAPTETAFKLDRLIGNGRGDGTLKFNWWLKAHFEADGSFRYVVEPNDYRIVGENSNWFRLFSSRKWDKGVMDKELQKLAELFALHEKR